MTLSLQSWLDLFHRSPILYKDFVKVFKVKSYNGQVSPLSDIIKSKSIKSSFVKMLYNVFEQDRIRYLTNFYNKSLDIKSYPPDETLPICIQNDKHTIHKNRIRNIYYKELLQLTNTIQPNIRNFFDVILDLFKHNIIDYKLLTPSSLLLLDKGTSLSSILSAYYFRSSIMNPTIPYSITTICNTDKIKLFTPTLGWSSYALGALSNPALHEYVGIDVIPKVCRNTEQLLRKHNIKHNIICKPSEHVHQDTSFLKKYKQHFDLVFFSPPYYELELYEGKLQSTNQYKEYPEWLEKYWRPTVQLCHHVLASNSIMSYIVSGYKHKGKYINLSKDMNSIMKQEGFTLKRSIHISTKNIKITKHKDLREKLYIFTKGNINISRTRFLTSNCKTKRKTKRKTKHKTRRTKNK